MLDLEVQPERSIGNEHCEFHLGMPFLQAINILKKQDRVVKGIQIWYSDQNPLNTDLVIKLSEDGIRLMFEANSQTLKIIEVYDLKKVNLKYCGVHFNSADINPTIDQIDQSFGATHPGEYKEDKQIFVLNFRGLSFHFHIDQKFEPNYIRGIDSIHFTKNSTPEVSKMFIYTGNNIYETRAPPMPLSCFYGNCYLEHLEVLRDENITRGIRCHIITEAKGNSKLSERESSERVVMFNDSCQDVISTLGCPSKLFYKSEDKMKIHAPDFRRFNRDACSDYFYNYITLGLDILFDAESHKVKKFVLHSNFPGHYDFNVYYRVQYSVPLTIEMPRVLHQPLEPVHKNIFTVDLSTKWDSIQDALLMSPESSKPVVLNRCSSTNTLNPFGRTYCHGIQDMIFEVMKNGHIATITFYQQNNPRHEL